MYSGRPPKAKFGFPVSKATASPAAVFRINTCPSEDGYTDTDYLAEVTEQLLRPNELNDLLIALLGTLSRFRQLRQKQLQQKILSRVLRADCQPRVEGIRR